MIQPDLWLGGIRITEPTVALTAVLMALVCLWAWLRLRQNSAPTPYLIWMQRFFWTMGLSSLLGGLIGHAFLHLVPFSWKMLGWGLGMVAVAAIAQAAIEDARPHLRAGWAAGLTRVNWAVFGVSAAVVSWKLLFPLVEAHAAFCLLGLVLPLQVAGLSKRVVGTARRKQLTLWGIGVAALAVVPHVLKWSLHTWFTYFDLGHVLMCVSMWLFLRAAEAPERLTTPPAV